MRSRGSDVIVQFFSDGDVSAAGFHATYIIEGGPDNDVIAPLQPEATERSIVELDGEATSTTSVPTTDVIKDVIATKSTSTVATKTSSVKEDSSRATPKQSLHLSDDTVRQVGSAGASGSGDAAQLRHLSSAMYAVVVLLSLLLLVVLVLFAFVWHHYRWLFPVCFPACMYTSVYHVGLTHILVCVLCFQTESAALVRASSSGGRS